MQETEKTAPTPVMIEKLKPMHKKMAQVFDCIRESGGKGSSTRTITDLVWGKNRADKKKDIQIYVSKLRKELEQTFLGRYEIIYEEKQYRLIDTEKDQKSPQVSAGY